MNRGMEAVPTCPVPGREEYLPGLAETGGPVEGFGSLGEREEGQLTAGGRLG